jgi:GNAT superfamily N-acetyltransferase
MTRRAAILRRWRRSRLRRLASRARRAIYLGHDDILIVARALEPDPPSPRGRRLRVEVATPADVPAMARLFAGHDGADMTEAELANLFATRMRAGPGAILGYHEDELFAFLWWADAESMPRVEPLLNVRYGVRLRPGDVYGFGLFVVPGERGAGLSTWFLASAEAELARLGKRRLLGYVLRANRSARWAFAITGHELLGPFTSDVLLSRLLRLNGTVYLVTRDGFRPLRASVPAWSRSRSTSSPARTHRTPRTASRRSRSRRIASRAATGASRGRRRFMTR